MRLSARQLNRTLLHRQHLLERTDATPHEMARHLVGLQAQENLPPYLSLAARLTSFDPYDVTARPGGPLAGAAAHHARHHPPAGGRRRADAAAVDRARCTSSEVKISQNIGRPPATWTARLPRRRSRRCSRTGRSRRRQLGAALAERFPDVPPTQLGAAGAGRRAARAAAAARHLEGSRWRWSTSASTAGWAGRWSSPTSAAIVRRYLRAFGPAHGRRRHRLVGRHPARPGAQGDGRPGRARGRATARRLYDVPGAELVDADTPAPVRLLGELRQRLALPRRARPGDRRPDTASAGWA